MKEKVHPQYFTQAKVVCSCGNTFTIGSTKKEIHVELCSKCHPFYTGAQRMVDTAGRVERFRRRYEKQAEKKD
jgi:large subunit ribosomal protein L31